MIRKLAHTWPKLGRRRLGAEATAHVRRAARGTALASLGLLGAALIARHAVPARAQIPGCAVITGDQYVIGDRVWNDPDQDGVQDPGEYGLPDVTVRLFRIEGGVQLVAQCSTTDDGNYWFDASAGTHFVEFVRPTGYVLSPMDVGDDLLDSDANPTNGRTPTFTLTHGNPAWHSARWDAGMKESGSGSSASQEIGLDHGDAPLTFPQTEHTVFASNGTMQPTLSLNVRVDTEDEAAIVRTGHTGKLSVGDDHLVDVTTSDEDAVPFVEKPPGVNHHVVVRGRTETYKTPVMGAGLMNAWIDFNLDGTWDNGSERVATNVPTRGGLSQFTFTVPDTAAITYDPQECVDDPTGCHDWQDDDYRFSYMRIRLSSQPLDDPTSPAADGEVEDHSIDIINGVPDVAVDFESVSSIPGIVGTAFTYRMLVQNHGFATATQVEVNQQLPPGMQFVSEALVSGPTGASVECDVNPATNMLTCTISDLPAPMPVPQVRYDVNVFLSSAMGCDSMTSCADITIAETEWFLVNNHDSITTTLEGGNLWDFADGPISNDTVGAQRSPRHGVQTGLHVGNTGPDPEPFPLVSQDAIGDDVTGDPDEDVFDVEAPLIWSCNNGGQPGTIAVVAASPGTLSAWFNFNDDAVFEDTAAERILHNVPLGAGTNLLAIPVPCTAVPGPTYARFRFVGPGGTVDSATDPECALVPAGEVEDHVFLVFDEPTPAEVAIEKTDLFDPVAEGEEFSYKIAVQNVGSERAQNVYVADTLPSALEYVSFSTTHPDAACAVALPTISCIFPELKSGGRASITIVVRAKNNIVPVGTPPNPGHEALDIENMATVDWNGGTQRSTTETTRIVEPCTMDLVLAIDVSGSISGSDRAAIGQHAIDLLDALGVGAPEDRNRGAVVTFGVGLEQLVHLTAPRSQLDATLSNLTGSLTDGTDLAVGLNEAQAELDLNGRKDAGGRRTALPVIVLLSDGNQTTGFQSMWSAAQAAKAQGTRIYTVGYPSSGMSPLGRSFMRIIATRADYALLAADVDDIGQRFEEFAAIRCPPEGEGEGQPDPTPTAVPICATIAANRTCAVSPTPCTPMAPCYWDVLGTLNAPACSSNPGQLYSLNVKVTSCDSSTAWMRIVLPSGTHVLAPGPQNTWVLSLTCLPTLPSGAFRLEWYNLSGGGSAGQGPAHVDYTVCCMTCP